MTYFNKPPTAEEVLKTLAEQPAKLVRQLTGTEEVRKAHQPLTWPVSSQLVRASQMLLQEQRNVVQTLMSSNIATPEQQGRNICLVAGMVMMG